MRVSSSYCLFLALMLFLHHPVAALNWQGTGDMNNDNLTVIWTYIHANLKQYADAGTLQLFCQGLSSHLNARWDSAWNVVIARASAVLAKTYNDMILYGYAFRNHWMWFNGYIDQSITSEKVFSFVIWKDYNCQGWKTVGQNAPAESKNTGFTTAQKDVLTSLLTSTTAQSLLNDPWSVAKAIVDGVESSSQFAVANNHAYSIVLGQLFWSLQLNGRVCVVESGFYFSEKDYINTMIASTGGNQYGKFILFQTR